MYACSISDAKQNITEICELPHIEEKGGLETITAVGKFMVLKIYFWL